MNYLFLIFKIIYLFICFAVIHARNIQHTPEDYKHFIDEYDKNTHRFRWNILQ